MAAPTGVRERVCFPVSGRALPLRSGDHPIHSLKRFVTYFSTFYSSKRCLLCIDLLVGLLEKAKEEGCEKKVSKTIELENMEEKAYPGGTKD